MPREVLALAIQAEEEDGRIYADLATRIEAIILRTAKSLQAMHDEEDGHRHRLIEMYRKQFGEHIPLIRRQDVKGFITRKSFRITANLTGTMIRDEIETMEDQARNFYEAAIAQTSDAAVRQLLGDLAAEESKHHEMAEEMDEQQKVSGAREEEDDSGEFKFVLQIVQPGLAGLMDGSVSTLAPVFALAFATHSSHDVFLVGMAASLGAGIISMGFAEALSDDGVLSGRGHPLARGIVCGLMTTAGGIGHTLPFLLSNFYSAMSIAVAVVAVELAVDCLGAPSLHGYAIALRDLSGDRRRDDRFYRGDFDRVGLITPTIRHPEFVAPHVWQDQTREAMQADEEILVADEKKRTPSFPGKRMQFIPECGQARDDIF